MIEQKEPKTRPVEKSLQKELMQCHKLLASLAHQQEASTGIIELIDKEPSLAQSNEINASVIFLTDKKASPNIIKALQWVGIRKELNEKLIFNGASKGVIGFNSGMRLRIHLFHFDHFPKRQLGDLKPALYIVVYDPAFLKSYGNTNIALEVLGLYPGVVFSMNVSETDENAEQLFSKIPADHTAYFNVNTLKQGLNKELEPINRIKVLQRIAIRNEFQTLKTIYELLCQDQTIREDELKGKSILFFKKQLGLRKSSTKLSGRETSELKSILDKECKQLLKSVDEKIENFEKEEPRYKALQEEITSFLGFVESKGGRYISMEISDGAVKDKVGKNQALLQEFFDQKIDHANEELHGIEEKLKTSLTASKLNVAAISLPKISKTFTKEILESANVLPNRSFEKQVTSKGIGSLLMELRTPLFMLMPFMMIFALFGALVGGEDKGTIDETVFFYNSRPCVAINSLPEARAGSYSSLINDIKAARDPRKGIFDKEISEELLTEPQLAVVKTEKKASFGNKTKVEETLDFYFDSKNGIIYLYLVEHGDREFVIEQLFEPANKLLAVADTTRRGFGLGGLIRSLSGLTEYRFLILFGLVGLVLWFVTTRKNSMDSELLTAKNREKQKLNNDLKQVVDKKNQLLHNIERLMERHTAKLQQEKVNAEKIVQKKGAALKTEKTQLASLKTDHRKVKLKLEQLEQKIKRSK